MSKKRKEDERHRDERTSGNGTLFWITNPREQLRGSDLPIPSFQSELAKINRYITDRYTWNDTLISLAEADPSLSANTLLTTLKLGVSVEIHQVLEQLVATHEKRKQQTLQQLRASNRKNTQLVSIIQSAWSMTGLDRRADEPQASVTGTVLKLVEQALMNNNVKFKDVDTLSNLFNDQIYLVRALKSVYKEGLVEIAAHSTDYLDHFQLMKELIQLAHDYRIEAAPHKEHGPERISDDTYSKILQLCTTLLPRDQRVPAGSIVGDLYTLSMEFDRPASTLAHEKALSSQARRALATGSNLTELFKQIWSSLPYVICDPTHPSYPHLIEFLKTYRSVIHVNSDGEQIDYFQQLAVWFVFFDLVNPAIDVVVLMDMLEKNDDECADVARYFFEYTKQSVQRYPTSPEEAQAMFTLSNQDTAQQQNVMQRALDGFRKIFSHADTLFDVEKTLSFQQLVKTVIESEDRDFIPLADQGIILSEQLGIRGSHHMIRVSFEENEDKTSYQLAVNLTIDQYSESEELDDDDLSYRLRFVVTGEYDGSDVIVSCPWRSSGSPELQHEIEQRLLLILTQHLIVTSQVDRQKIANQAADAASEQDYQDEVTPPHDASAKEKAPKRKVLRRNRQLDNTTSSPESNAALSASVNMTERQKFLPLSLELSADLQTVIDRELAKDPAASPYAELLTFIQRYNHSQGLDLMVNSQKVRTSPGTFRLRTYNEGVLDDYRLFYERDGGGLGRITGISYRDKKTYK